MSVCFFNASLVSILVMLGSKESSSSSSTSSSSPDDNKSTSGASHETEFLEPEGTSMGFAGVLSGSTTVEVPYNNN